MTNVLDSAALEEAKLRASSMRCRANILETALNGELKVAIMAGTAFTADVDVSVSTHVTLKKRELYSVKLNLGIVIKDRSAVLNPTLVIGAANGDYDADAILHPLVGEHGPVIDAIVDIPFNVGFAPKVIVRTVDIRS